MFSRFHRRMQSAVAPVVQSLEDRRMFAADLIVTSIDANPVVIPPGGTFNFDVTIKNQGDVAVPPGWMFLPRLTQDDVLGGSDDRSLGNRTFTETLNPGESRTVNVATSLSLIGPRGSFKIIVRLDPYFDSNDGDRTNNTFLSSTAPIHIVETFSEDSIAGTSGNDVILLRKVSGYLMVTVNGETRARQGGLITQPFFVDGGAGNDKIIADDTVDIRLAITGAGGNDTIVGGTNNDELSGGNGNDRIFGGRGHDFLIGGAGSDRLYGEEGNDILAGHGGNDWLYGGPGGNWLMGGAGNDKLFARNSDRDTVSGNAGNDYAETDPMDVVAGIQSLG